MKILVCISKTPDTTAKIAFTDNNTKFAGDDIQWIINPYDEWYALGKAISIKEKEPETLIHLAHVGLSAGDPIIRKALALGGDEAIRIDCDPSDSWETALQLATLAKSEKYDLILTGRETIDYNNAAVGPFIAEILDLHFAANATHLNIEQSIAQVTREVDGGFLTEKVMLPLVVGCQKGMAEPRIPNMRGIMGARSKTIRVINPIDFESRSAYISFQSVPPKSGVKLIPADNPAELVRLLREEAKVL
jgi:electron transfer flavoprotein beta subunit